MRFFAAVALFVAGASAATLDYGAMGRAGDGYGAGEARTSVPAPAYGGETRAAEMRCTPFYETQVQEKCESYVEKTCRTTQVESCQDVAARNCKPIVSSKQVRKCLNVTEQLCRLREDVQYEMVNVNTPVQTCERVSERVCDTVFDIDVEFRDDTQCMTVENPVCESQDMTVFERTCRTTTNFDCPTSLPGIIDATGRSGNDAYGTDAYGAADRSGSDFGAVERSGAYGVYEPKCYRKEETKCYQTPRTVSVTRCSQAPEQVCEKVRIGAPFVSERQACHDEEKKVCSLSERQTTKQVKKFTYATVCKPHAKRLCDNTDEHRLVPQCVPSTRKACSYSPVENCEDTPKQHCYQLSRQIRKEKCEMVAPRITTATYAEPAVRAAAGDDY